MKTIPMPTPIRRILSRLAQDRMSLAVIFTAVALSCVSVRAADTEESWQSVSDGYTNPAAWSPQISSPGGITNWPNDLNGAGVDYAVVITGAGGNATDTCWYTNTDINGTNMVGQLSIGGYGAGLGGGSISNAFIMTGGMLTVTDFTASASAGYAFSMGGNNVANDSLLDTNYFIMTGGTFNSTNVSGGNNWIGEEASAVNYVYWDGGTVNLDGLFLGGYGSGTVTINGSTVNFYNQSGGGTPGAIAFGWEPANFFTLNLMSGTLNITNKSPSINFHANTKSAGTFTLNVSGGVLNASEINFGNTPNGVATNLLNFSGGNINLGSGGIFSAATSNNTNLLIMSGGTFSTLPGQNWAFSSSTNPIINILTNTPGNGTVTFAPLAGQFITLNGIISGPGAMDVAGPGFTVFNAVMGFTGGVTVNGGTLAINKAQTESLGLNVVSGADLQIDNVNNALVDSPISIPAGSSLIFSNTAPIVFASTVNGGGNLLVDGGGAVTNNGNLQFTGDTFVNAGDLVIAGSGSVSSPITFVASNATLDVSQLSSFAAAGGQTITGNGTILAPAGGITFNSGATLEAGLSFADSTLTLSGNLTFAAGSTNYVFVNKGYSSPNGEIIGLNSVTMGGAIFVSNVGVAPFAPGDVFPLFSAASYNTNGYKIVPATPGAGMAWAVTNGTLYVVGSFNPNLPAITNQPVSAVVNPGIAFTNTVGASGAQPLYYQWFQYPSDTPIAGATNASLVLDPVVAGDATNYIVEVTNTYGSAFSRVVNLGVNSTPVLANEFPITYTNLFLLYAGARPTFSLSASSVLPATVSYQWYTNGVGVGGATNPVFTLTNLSVGYLTNVCVVTNGAGVATNAVWTALVLSDPTNRLGGPAPYPQAVLALNPIAYWRFNEPESGGGDGGVIANDYAGGNNGIYTNVVLGQSPYNALSDPSDTSVEVGSSSFTPPGYVDQFGTNIDFSLPSGHNAEFTVECWLLLTGNSGGGIITKGWGNGGEEFCLDTGNTSSHDFRFFVRSAAGTSYPASSTITPAFNQWYHLVGVCDEANGIVSLYVNGTLAASDTIPANSGIVSDSPVNLTIGARSSSQSNGTQIPPDLDLPTIGQINDVAIFNYALSSTQIANEYVEAGGAPVITQQPASVDVGAGSNATLTVVVGGTPPLSYQWFETNLTAQTGHALTGQTNATMVVSNVESSDSFFVNVSNPYGSTNSDVATVSVYSSPLIINQYPITYVTVLNTNYMTLYAGANPTFSVQALGFGSLYYQWFTNGIAAGGATNSSYTEAESGPATSITWCIVTNYLGSATSAVWSASVLGGLAAYPQSVLALKPIGYWRLNESDDNQYDGNPGAIAHDYAGGNNGLYNNVYLGDSDGGTGYNPTEDPSDTSVQLGYFATTNCVANYIGTNVDFATPSGSNAEFSVECWMDITTHSISGLITKGYGNGGEEFSLDVDAAGGTNYKFFVRDAGGGNHTAQSTFTPNLNTWYHMAGVCDEANGTVTLYVDGQPVAVGSIPEKDGVLNSKIYNLVIGARSSSLGNQQLGNLNNQTIGYMNDVAVFGSALTSGQIAAQYDAGGGTVAPYFDPTPSTNVTGLANATLTIPVTAIGTPPMTYYWTNLTTGAVIETGVTNTATTLNAGLSYANVPASWNGDQVQVTASNAFGTTNALVKLTIQNINLNPTNIVFAVTNNQLSLSWPADHIGWQLQAQTNSTSVGLNTNWVNVPGSTGTNEVLFPVTVANGCVFFRLVYP